MSTVTPEQNQRGYSWNKHAYTTTLGKMYRYTYIYPALSQDSLVRVMP